MTTWICSRALFDSPDEDAHAIPSVEEASHVTRRNCTCQPRLLCRVCLSAVCALHSGLGRIVCHNEAS